MTAQERLKRKRRRQMRRKLGLLLPIAAVVLLIAGLTAGGILISLNQSKNQTGSQQNESISQNRDSVPEAGKTDEAESDKAAKEEETAAEALTGDDEAVSEEPEETEQTEKQEEETAGSETTFASVRKALTEAVAADPAALTVESSGFETARQQLLKISPEELDPEESDLYDILMDHMNLEEEGFPYRNNSLFAGQRLCTVENGQDYYIYLLRKLTGTDLQPQEIHEILAAELNSNRGTMEALAAMDVSLPQTSQTILKNQAASAYLYQTVTAGSDPLKLAVIPEGLRTGWAEFGLIRAYQMDDTLAQSMKDYVIAATRMSYAMYGVLDISVHYGGWEQAEVTNLVNDFYGGGQEAFAARTYQEILDNPGRYAAAAIGYQKEVQIEAALAAGTEGYTEQTLLDFLFGRGPGSFRVLEGWLNGSAGQEGQQSQPGETGIVSETGRHLKNA